MGSNNTEKFYAVMLVDDSEIDNLINQKMVEVAGITENIYTYSGAKGAIEFLKNIEQLSDLQMEIRPSIIFLDIDMPLVDGFQFIEQFNQLSKETREFCKVVILTSSINPHDLNQAKKNDNVFKYLNKPLTQEAISKLITEIKA